MRFVRVPRSCSARLATAAVLVTTLVVVSGCASSGHAAKPGATVVPVSERDFKITAQRHVLAAGKVDFAVSIAGPTRTS